MELLKLWYNYQGKSKSGASSGDEEPQKWYEFVDAMYTRPDQVSQNCQAEMIWIVHIVLTLLKNF